MNILLADDERQLTDALSEILKRNNYNVTVSHDGEQALDAILSGIYDLAILDVMMPKLDGFSVVKKMRLNKIDTPVLMLTAKSETADKIYGLNLGADDYITKPFDSNELLARIKALLRRKEKFTGDILSFGDISLDRDTLEIVQGENRMVLGKKEFQLLENLMLNSGKCVGKERLIEKIWGYDSEAEYNTIEVYVSFLRRKLLAINSIVEIKSIRGVGYTIGEKND